jgi:Sulfotransferase domain
VITAVSGLPRSGTSLMMQMLAAGGLIPLTDGLRVSDVNNPRGYFEWERIKQLPSDPACIADAEGKVVKVISALLRSLPSGHAYRIIFMRRSLEEVVASQKEMLKQLGASGASMPGAAMMAAFETHLKQVSAWLESREEIEVCRVEYGLLLREPLREAGRVQEFLNLPLDVEAMARQVDGSLHRQRAPAPRVGSGVVAPC